MMSDRKVGGMLVMGIIFLALISLGRAVVWLWHWMF